MLLEDITDESIIFDCGGYKGHTSELILEICKKYKNVSPYIYIYEPVKSWSKRLKRIFESYPKVTIINKAITNEVGRKMIYIRIRNPEDASLKYTKNYSKKQEVITSTLKEEMKQLNIPRIDLLKLNIEGSESDVIESITPDMVKKINQITINFHTNTIYPCTNILNNLGYNAIQLYDNDGLFTSYKIKKEIMDRINEMNVDIECNFERRQLSILRAVIYSDEISYITSDKYSKR